MAVAFKGGDAVFLRGGGGYTWNHNVTGVADRLALIASVCTAGGGSDTSAAAYNGVALTKFGSSWDANGGPEMGSWWRLVAPATGTHAFTVTASPYSQPLVAFGDWDGVDQTTPLTAGTADTGNSAGATSTSNTVPTDGQAVGVLTTNYGGSSPAASAGTTMVGTPVSDTDTTGAYIVFGYRTSTGTIGFTWSGSIDWDLRTVILNPSGGGGGGGVVKRLLMMGVGA